MQEAKAFYDLTLSAFNHARDAHLWNKKRKNLKQARCAFGDIDRGLATSDNLEGLPAQIKFLGLMQTVVRSTLWESLDSSMKTIAVELQNQAKEGDLTWVSNAVCCLRILSEAVGHEKVPINCHERTMTRIESFGKSCLVRLGSILRNQSEVFKEQKKEDRKELVNKRMEFMKTKIDSIELKFDMMKKDIAETTWDEIAAALGMNGAQLDDTIENSLITDASKLKISIAWLVSHDLRVLSATKCAIDDGKLLSRIDFEPAIIRALDGSTDSTLKLIRSGIVRRRSALMFRNATLIVEGDDRLFVFDYETTLNAAENETILNSWMNDDPSYSVVAEMVKYDEAQTGVAAIRRMESTAGCVVEKITSIKIKSMYREVIALGFVKCGLRGFEPVGRYSSWKWLHPEFTDSCKTVEGRIRTEDPVDVSNLYSFVGAESINGIVPSVENVFSKKFGVGNGLTDKEWDAERSRVASTMERYVIVASDIGRNIESEVVCRGDCPITVHGPVGGSVTIDCNGSGEITTIKVQHIYDEPQSKSTNTDEKIVMRQIRSMRNMRSAWAARERRFKRNATFKERLIS